jgi:PAS domain S-box-containing protein
MELPGPVTQEPECSQRLLNTLIVTDKLTSRPQRAPNYQAENKALVSLAETLANRSDDMFQKLVEHAVALCGAHSAGMSLLDEANGEPVFRWRAIHGPLRPFVDQTMPRFFSPCGLVLDENKPILIQNPILYYPYVSRLGVQLCEVLLVPFQIGGRSMGTLWVVAHDTKTQFVQEDLRCLESLCKFAAASVSALQNIQALETTSRRLQDVQDRMDTALGIGAIATWVWDIAANRVYADNNLASLFGVSARDAEGGKIEHYIEAIHPDDRPCVRQNIQIALQSHGNYEADYRIHKEGRALRWVSARGRVMEQDGSKGARLIGVVVDITERRKIEDQLRIKTEQLAAASQRKDEFLATLSHELRSPLNIIQGHTELLRLETPGTEEFEVSLDAIERSARLQTQLISDMLDVSRIITGKMLLDISVFDPKEIVQDAMRAIQFAADAKSITLHAEIEAKAGMINGDRGRLQQALWNFLANAVKFSPQGSRVVIQVSRKHGFMEFQVNDQGQGITPEFLPHVFDRFHQEDGSKSRKYGGLGLGLAIVRHIAELHGGSVQATSPGKNLGSTFTLSIPVVAVMDDVHDDGQAPDRAGSRSLDELAPRLNSYRILVVDDQTEASSLLKRSLEMLGAEVMTASSAHEAWARLEARALDILVSDIGMPDINGFDLIRTWRLREKKLNRRPLPAIALTAYGTQDDKAEILAAGFTGHLAKPAGLRELVSMILQEVTKQPLSCHT